MLNLKLNCFQIVSEDEKVSDTLFPSSPFQRLFSLGTFQNSSFPAAHLSDALRLLYLYKVCIFLSEIRYIPTK